MSCKIVIEVTDRPDGSWCASDKTFTVKGVNSYDALNNLAIRWFENSRQQSGEPTQDG